MVSLQVRCGKGAKWEAAGKSFESIEKDNGCRFCAGFCTAAANFVFHSKAELCHT
jgi:coenzyme F420-reducing hydrogenase beta subunit